ncbi:MAG TPA: hypothetical protein PLR23_06925 [Candidatus Cloacimonas acidaminovorans]|nr:hypothetical protein [Candidatus Cloacimonas acidaminovorans]
MCAGLDRVGSIKNSERKKENMVMLTKKVLFIDEPFTAEEGIRAERSRFLWNVISKSFDADLLLLKSPVYMEKPVSLHTGYDKLYSLSLRDENNLESESYHLIGKGQKERFINILDSKRYEVIFFAGLACLPLVCLAKKILPQCKLIIDIEKVWLPEIKEKWKDNKQLKNANYLWQYIRQTAWNKYLPKKGMFCLYANPGETDELFKCYHFKPENTHFVPLPITTIPELDKPGSNKKFILFWGAPESKDNLTAVKNIISEIYPRISKKMVEKEISIVLCGGEELQGLCSGRITYAPYSEKEQLLQEALLVLLPLNKPDTEGRILTCAQFRKTLVCTLSAIKNFPLPEDSYLASDDFAELSEKIIELFRSAKKLDEYANKLSTFCFANFTPEKVENALLTKINSWIGNNVSNQ